MKLSVQSNVFKTAVFAVLTLGALTLGGCQTSRQAQQELEQENIALERRIQENYAFMQHQQRRINALEAQLPEGKDAPRPKSSSRRPAPSSSPSPLRSSRHEWVNPDTGLSEEPEAQPAGDFDSPLDQLNVDPNGEPNISVPSSPSQNVPKNLFRNNGSQTSLQPALPELSMLPTVNVSDIAEISLDPEQIGPLQIDFDSQEQGLRMVLNCRTKQGEFAVAVGQVTIVALDPSLQGEQARVARWDISPAQVERQIKQAPQPDGILFELAWPKEKPKGNVIDVFVRMEDGQGARLQTRQQVQMDGMLYALWTPPQEEALPIDDSVDAPVEQRVAEMEALPQIESEPEEVGEVQQGEISKSVIVVASPQVEALRDRTRTEIPPAMVLTSPQVSPDASNQALTASTAVPGMPIGQNAADAAAPVATANTAPSANPASPAAKPAGQMARPTWSPYR
ncbi:MAG: hypothetical protein IKX40_12865 [Thermoguttaceae bacterium]|nr:hypothetical protein [Thermoguttaceae bacterium]